MISQAKEKLRQKILAQLKNFSAAERDQQNRKIQKDFLALSEFSAARKIAFFASEEFEVSTDFLITWSLQAGKKISLPRVEKDSCELEFHAIQNLDELEVGCFGINCPAISTPKIPLAEIDLLVVPGLAFTTAGDRLGRGGGFFDRVLANFSGVSVGLAFDFQILSELPTEKWDEKVSKVLAGD